MTDYSSILICTDIDGTLTYESGKISQKNIEAIERFKRGGGHFTYTTGRYVDFIRDLPIKANAPIMAYNGALIVAPDGDVLHTFTMPSTCYADTLTAIGRSKDVCAVNICCGKDSFSWHPGDDVALLNVPDLFKTVFVFSNDGSAVELRDLSRELFSDRYNVIRSWGSGLEWTAKGVGKGECLPYVKEHLPDVKFVIGVGDYENDLSLIRCSDLGCAPENALGEIKEAADVVLPANDKDAFAYLIDNLDRLLSL